MGSTRDGIDTEMREWIERQLVFFVATAPLSADGHVNMSPKGLDTFAVTGERSVRYLDLTGSAAETVAHLGENGRITIMFCAFEDPPRILRLYGRGTAHLVGTTGFDEGVRSFAAVPHSTRAVIDVEVSRVQTSCGFGVPLAEDMQPRDRLTVWASARDSDQLAEYRLSKNRRSIDGLPAFDDQGSARG